MLDTLETGDSDFVREAYRRLSAARKHQADWRKEAREDFAFVAGDQWDDADLEKLRKELRPCITFNRVGPTVDTVAGLEITNRQETTYIPRGISDGGIAEAESAAAKYFRDQCDAEDEESEAFMDATVCGLGWTETRMDYDYSQEGSICVERVDPFEMFYDPNANKANLCDGRYLFRVKKLTKAQFKEMFPNAPEDIGAKPDLGTDDADIVLDNPRDQYRTGERAEDKSEDIWIIEYQWVEKSRVALVKGDTGIVEMPMDRYQTLGMDGAPERMNSTYMRAFIAGTTVLKKGPGPCKYSFTYKAITAKRDRNKGTWYGIVRAMKDPQRWANKWLSQSLHILNSNAKGGALIEEDALKNPRKAEEDWAKPEALILLKPGGSQKIKDRPMGQMPAGFDRLMTFAVQSMRDVTGINMEMMGLADRQQAGIVENARKQAGFTIVARLFNSFRRYRKEQGRLMMHFIQEYIPEGTLIRIGEPGQAQWMPLLKRADALQYDIVVDDAPFSPNQKEAVWDSMQQLFPVLAKMPIPPQVWQAVLPYSPLPASAVQKVTEALSQPVAPDPQVQAQQMQMQMDAQNQAHEMQIKGMDAQQRASESQAGLQIKQMEIQIKALELEMKRVEAMAKMHEVANGGMTGIETMKTMADIANVNADTDQTRVETALMPAELQAKMSKE